MTQSEKLLKAFMILFSVFSIICLLIGIMLAVSVIINVEIASPVTKFILSAVFVVALSIPGIAFFFLRKKLQQGDTAMQKKTEKENKRNMICSYCGGVTPRKEINCQYCQAPLEH